MERHIRATDTVVSAMQPLIKAMFNKLAAYVSQMMRDCADKILPDMPAKYKDICVLSVRESMMHSKIHDKYTFSTSMGMKESTVVKPESQSKESSQIQSAQRPPAVKYQELSQETEVADYSDLLGKQPKDADSSREKVKYKLIPLESRITDRYERHKASRPYVASTRMILKPPESEMKTKTEKPICQSGVELKYSSPPLPTKREH